MVRYGKPVHISTPINDVMQAINGLGQHEMALERLKVLTDVLQEFSREDGELLKSIDGMNGSVTAVKAACRVVMSFVDRELESVKRIEKQEKEAGIGI